MKRLRILTGKHVGAHLDLLPGTHLVGAGNDCDITITDWTFAPLQLTIDRHAVRCSWHQSGPAAAGKPRRPAAGGADIDHSLPLADLEPREFDGIVLCIGPVDEPWPTDVQLLSVVFAPVPNRVARWALERVPRRGMFIAVAGLVVISLGLSLPWLNAAPVQPLPPTLEETRARIQLALDRVAGGRLRAQVENRSIFVSGMAETSQEAEAGRAAIAANRGPHIAVPRFAVATDIAEAIRSTAGLTNPSVRHVGGGVFVVEAEVTDERAARNALDRMSADLAPAVTQIKASFEKIYPNDPLGPILSRSQIDGLSVVQTRDGVKHLVLDATKELTNEPPDAPAAAAASAPKPSQPVSAQQATARAVSLKGATP